jgi:hypothetical protein
VRRLALALALLLAPMAGAAQEAASGSGAVLRVLDKQTGSAEDVTLSTGDTVDRGLIRVRLDDCRYPPGNPAGDAWAYVTVFYRGAPDAVFRGWMVASAPALNALDHPRFDVWVLRCITS